ncbi:MAG: hypothetical protein HY888_08630 [Deltaproteobacteria bacterium]|nr:hypothetical protein [Deltaproteobacteria bacterium]
MEKPASSATTVPTDFQPQADKAQQATPKAAVQSKASTDVKPIRAIQTSVAANCPYCNHKHELPFEKGKNGKPFFVACTRCNTEFAVRFVPVTIYQAQVAAFK